MTKQKLTKRVVESAPVPETGEGRIWDSEIAGFCVRIYPGTETKQGHAARAVRRIFAIKYRVRGIQRWLTLGEFGDGPDKLTAERARREAASVVVDARRGIDPGEARRRIVGLTVKGMVELYLEKGPNDKPTKREATWAVDRTNLERHVVPLLGKMVLETVTRDHITGMIRSITAGKTARDVRTVRRGRSIVKGGAGIADRTYSTLRATFNWAIDKGHFAGPNPCAKVKREIRPAVERFLSESQAQALITALDALEAEKTLSERQGAVFRLLLLTGARRNEIAGLRWTEVDFDRRRLVLPPSRTKAGGRTGDRRISLNDVAFRILERLHRNRDRSQFVFPASKGDSGYATSEPKIWRDKVLPKAGLEGVRIHDLRHSFASFALADGASLPMIGKALGHANSRATERYAHLSDDPVRALAERIGERFSPKI
ncbi:tyrosine-type recombinase/integrase [Brevundimonas fontaquae]|uniref:Tyrosine-type recombinase/integrase n=1 Tax=Brevundimonas fontaquae TaxID=2813778 RepID=A0ABX7LPY0_9CAUL|nr:site-specific integrase [Brevundimonas fontaquae]QSF54873.1 tyrosine-type recombinase/integrase [Brevundimonas fontaquae]